MDKKNFMLTSISTESSTTASGTEFAICLSVLYINNYKGTETRKTFSIRPNQIEKLKTIMSDVDIDEVDKYTRY